MTKEENKEYKELKPIYRAREAFAVKSYLLAYEKEDKESMTWWLKVIKKLNA